MNGETENPLAKQLRDQQDQRDLATGREGLEEDFIAAGKAQAPARLGEVWDLVQEYIKSYDAQRTAGTPSLRCPGKPPSFQCIGANKFTASFEGITGLKEYILRVTVGYHAMISLTMHNPPNIQRSEWVYQAYADDEDLWWRGPEGDKCTSELVVRRATEALGALVTGGDRRGR